MDLDEDLLHERVLKTETIFAKSAELTATFYAQLPLEVTQALKTAGK